MTPEDEAAVKLTAQYAAKPSVGSSLQAAFKAAKLNGHALVSQGSPYFRCVKCQETGSVFQLFKRECEGEP